MKATKKLLSVIMAILIITVTITGGATTVLAATAPSPTSITSICGRPAAIEVSWKKVDKVTGYQIRYSTLSNFSNAAVTTVNNPGTTTFTIKNRAQNKKYYVQMRTYKKANNKTSYSAWTKIYNVTTRNKNEPYSTYIQSLKSGLGSITASWKKIGNANGYQLKYATKSDFSNSATTTIKSNSNTKTISSLAANKKYYIKVRAYRTVNGKNYYSPWSAIKNITTKGLGSEYTPVFKSVSSGIGSFTINWNKVNNANGYEIMYATKSDFSNSAVVKINNANTVKKTIDNRALNKRYYFKIRSYKTVSGKNYYSAWCSSKSVVTKSCFNAAPELTKISITQSSKNIAISGSFTFTWTGIDNADGYQIQYATKSDFSNAASIFKTNKDLGNNENNYFEYTIGNRAEGVKYYIRVRAYKNIANSTNKYYSDWSSYRTSGDQDANTITTIPNNADALNVQKQLNDYIAQKSKKATKDYYFEEYRTPLVDKSLHLFNSCWSTADYISLRSDKYYDWLHDGSGIQTAKELIDYRFRNREDVIGDNGTIDNFSEMYAYLVYENGVFGVFILTS